MFAFDSEFRERAAGFFEIFFASAVGGTSEIGSVGFLRPPFQREVPDYKGDAVHVGVVGAWAREFRALTLMKESQGSRACGLYIIGVTAAKVGPCGGATIRFPSPPLEMQLSCFMRAASGRLPCSSKAQ